jgi:hypothetical protein
VLLAALLLQQQRQAQQALLLILLGIGLKQLQQRGSRQLLLTLLQASKASAEQQQGLGQAQAAAQQQQAQQVHRWVHGVAPVHLRLELLVVQWRAASAMVLLPLTSGCSGPGRVQTGGSRRAALARQPLVT